MTFAQSSCFVTNESLSHNVKEVLTSSLDNVAQHAGQFPLPHLSGNLTPDTVWAETGAQTVVAQRPLSPKKREVKPQCTAKTCQ